MTSVQNVPATGKEEGPQEREQESKNAGEPQAFSKFNNLSVSAAFALTGLMVVYLPDIVGKSLDWKIEGRFIGIALALVGTVFILVAAGELTGRSGFGYWGIAILLGTITAVIVALLHVYHMPKWLAIILTILAITLIFIAAYAIVGGFTSFFEKPLAKTADLDEIANLGQDSSTVQGESVEEKKLGWYERVTLIIAVIATIATVLAAIEPIVL